MTDQVGWVHLLLNQLPEALRRFEEAIHLDQGNALYLCHKAATLYRLEQFAQAEDVIERALLMDPDPFVEAFCHFIIGISLEAQGLENSYERQMEESIELVPASSWL
jgi:tetratricopeptide (TPR) repeat protein